jgi:hypothetical protein
MASVCLVDTIKDCGIDMTVPFERVSAVNRTRQFLIDLMDPKATPRVPKAIRQQARSLLRHYPNAYEMEIVCENEQLLSEKHPLLFRVFKKDF